MHRESIIRWTYLPFNGYSHGYRPTHKLKRSAGSGPIEKPCGGKRSHVRSEHIHAVRLLGLTLLDSMNRGTTNIGSRKYLDFLHFASARDIFRTAVFWDRLAVEYTPALRVY